MAPHEGSYALLKELATYAAAFSNLSMPLIFYSVFSNENTLTKIDVVFKYLLMLLL